MSGILCVVYYVWYIMCSDMMRVQQKENDELQLSSNVMSSNVVSGNMMKYIIFDIVLK